MDEIQQALARHNIKDSVFCHLFGQEVYTLELYQALHPEDTTATKEDIGIVTLENVYLSQPYNDLGFTVGNRLLILVEAQNTWTMNIIVRMLLYAAQTIQNHITNTNQNVYGTKKITFPEPEFYVLYTGNQKERPEMLSLVEEFRTANLDLKVRVLYDGNQGDIINQYVIFTQVYNEQRKRHGNTQTAVLETIRICKDRNVLKSYLASNEREVVDIMMTLFNYENILKNYILDEREDARTEGIAIGETKGRAEGVLQTMISLVKDGLLDLTTAASRLNMTVDEFQSALASH